MSVLAKLNEEHRKTENKGKMAKAVGGGEDREMVLFYSKESRRTRREETISRFRFGHTGLNSSLFIIGKNQMGKCSSKLLNMFCSIVKIIRKREEN